MKDKELFDKIQKVIDVNSLQPGRLNEMLGLKIKDCSRKESFAEFIYDVSEWALNPYDGVHGGIICSLFDTTMGIGSVALTERFVTTTDISVSFVKPMTGKQYSIQLQYNHIGKNMARCTGRAIDTETGIVCATAMGSFMLLKNYSFDNFEKGIKL